MSESRIMDTVDRALNLRVGEWVEVKSAEEIQGHLGRRSMR